MYILFETDRALFFMNKINTGVALKLNCSKTISFIAKRVEFVRKMSRTTGIYDGSKLEQVLLV